MPAGTAASRPWALPRSRWPGTARRRAELRRGPTDPRPSSRGGVRRGRPGSRVDWTRRCGRCGRRPPRSGPGRVSAGARGLGEENGRARIEIGVRAARLGVGDVVARHPVRPRQRGAQLVEGERPLDLGQLHLSPGDREVRRQRAIRQHPADVGEPEALVVLPKALRRPLVHPEGRPGGSPSGSIHVEGPLPTVEGRGSREEGLAVEVIQPDVRRGAGEEGLEAQAGRVGDAVGEPPVRPFRCRRPHERGDVRAEVVERGRGQRVETPVRDQEVENDESSREARPSRPAPQGQPDRQSESRRRAATPPARVRARRRDLEGR